MWNHSKDKMQTIKQIFQHRHPIAWIEGGEKKHSLSDVMKIKTKQLQTNSQFHISQYILSDCKCRWHWCLNWIWFVSLGSFVFPFFFFSFQNSFYFCYFSHHVYNFSGSLWWAMNYFGFSNQSQFPHWLYHCAKNIFSDEKGFTVLYTQKNRMIFTKRKTILFFFDEDRNGNLLPL